MSHLLEEGKREVVGVRSEMDLPRVSPELVEPFHISNVHRNKSTLEKQNHCVEEEQHEAVDSSNQP